MSNQEIKASCCITFVIMKDIVTGILFYVTVTITILWFYEFMAYSRTLLGWSYWHCMFSMQLECSQLIIKCYKVFLHHAHGTSKKRCSLLDLVKLKWAILFLKFWKLGKILSEGFSFLALGCFLLLKLLILLSV